jgi:hypothetical protein
MRKVISVCPRRVAGFRFATSCDISTCLGVSADCRVTAETPPVPLTVDPYPLGGGAET